MPETVCCRAVWNAVSKDNRIVLSSVQSTLLQKRPQSDHDLLLAAMGPYATVLSASCQTGDNLHQQDTQTSFIPVRFLAAAPLIDTLCFAQFTKCTQVEG